MLFHYLFLFFLFQISYSLKDDHKTFSIAPDTGDIKLLRELDRETRDHYLVTVTATDNGSHRLSSNVEVTTFFSNEINKIELLQKRRVNFISGANFPLFQRNSSLYITGDQLTGIYKGKWILNLG